MQSALAEVLWARCRLLLFASSVCTRLHTSLLFSKRIVGFVPRFLLGSVSMPPCVAPDCYLHDSEPLRLRSARFCCLKLALLERRHRFGQFIHLLFHFMLRSDLSYVRSLSFLPRL